MSDAHNKLQLREYVTTETLNFVLDLNYFSFSNHNPTHLPKHQTLIISFLSVFVTYRFLLCAYGVKSEI